MTSVTHQLSDHRCDDGGKTREEVSGARRNRANDGRVQLNGVHVEQVEDERARNLADTDQD